MILGKEEAVTTSKKAFLSDKSESRGSGYGVYLSKVDYVSVILLLCFLWSKGMDGPLKTIFSKKLGISFLFKLLM